MDAPKKCRFRFGLRAILGLVALCGALLGILARRTDPLLARKGMTRAEIWWKCGGPDFVLQFVPDHWLYHLRGQPMDVNVIFENGKVVDASYVLYTDVQGEPELIPLPYVPATDVSNLPGKDADSPAGTE
jgi:hypothetical protein